MDKTEARETLIKAFDGALVTRGKNKGKLLRQCPPMGSDAAAAWQAVMLLANPYKVSLFSITLFNERQAWIYKELVKALEPLDLRDLDRDRIALERLGAW